MVGVPNHTESRTWSHSLSSSAFDDRAARAQVPANKKSAEDWRFVNLGFVEPYVLRSGPSGRAEG